MTGLSANGGSITFHKTVDEPGQYVLTIGFKKTASTTSKYAQIEVNGERTYETTIARTSGWSNTGRQQVYIDLDAGENTIKIFNPIDGQKADSIRRYSKMGNALKEATASVAEQTGAEEKPIFSPSVSTAEPALDLGGRICQLLAYFQRHFRKLEFRHEQL